MLLVAACSSVLSPTVKARGEPQSPEKVALDEGLSRQQTLEHLLARATFGPTREDRVRLEQMGISAFLEEQLNPERIDDAALEERLARFQVLKQGSDELVRDLAAQRQLKKVDAILQGAPPPPEGEQPLVLPSMADKATAGRDLVAQLSEAKVLRAVFSERQLQEVMVDFWFNHFNVFAGKQDEAALLPEYEERVLRRNALASFPALLEASAHSPAMLIYLDNWRSAAPRPRQQRGINENYAREILELHTLGVDGGYTQRDVVEVARCFTGWTVEEPQKRPRFVFRPGMHDFGAKTVLGHSIPAGGGVEDGEQVLRILERHPSTARFIARKLSRRFVSDDPPESLVERVAQTYSESSGDIRSMLRTVFESPEFWSRSAFRAKVRSPLELVAAAVRALHASVDEPGGLMRAVARMGEPLYGAQPPTGYPDVAQTWLSSGALLARIDFGLQLAAGQVPGVRVDFTPLSGGTPDDLVRRAASQLGAPELSEQTRSFIVERLRASRQPARAVGLLLGAPELQRR